MPSVLAYSGVATPIKTFANPSIDATITNASPTDSYTLTTTQSGIIQSFLATVNIKDFAGAPAAGYLTTTLKRNGVLLSSSTTALDVWFATFGDAGIVYVETLGFLSGAQIETGEIFELALVLTSTGGGFVMTYDSTFTLIISPQPRAFLVP